MTVSDRDKLLQEITPGSSDGPPALREHHGRYIARYIPLDPLQAMCKSLPRLTIVIAANHLCDEHTAN